MGKGKDLLIGISDADVWEHQRCLAPEDVRVVLDVGAFRGRTVGRYLGLFPEATVYAFEPSPDNIARFRDYIPKILGWQRAILVQKAALDYTGKTDFYITPYECIHSVSRCLLQSPIKKVVVPCITVDDFCSQNGIEHIDVLKIDVEGAELRVLHGAKGYLERRRIGMIFCELRFFRFHEGQVPMWKICEFLDRHGFELHSFWPGRGGKPQVLEGNGLFVKG